MTARLQAGQSIKKQAKGQDSADESENCLECCHEHNARSMHLPEIIEKYLPNYGEETAKA